QQDTMSSFTQKLKNLFKSKKDKEQGATATKAQEPTATSTAPATETGTAATNAVAPVEDTPAGQPAAEPQTGNDTDPTAQPAKAAEGL
ncbi:hypothetical protein DH86_00002533, partial [Scytalidium sp. 3C]